jgi:hypothetical protein
MLMAFRRRLQRFRVPIPGARHSPKCCAFPGIQNQPRAEFSGSARGPRQDQTGFPCASAAANDEEVDPEHCRFCPGPRARVRDRDHPCSALLRPAYRQYLGNAGTARRLPGSRRVVPFRKNDVQEISLTANVETIVQANEGQDCRSQSVCVRDISSRAAANSSAMRCCIACNSGNLCSGARRGSYSSCHRSR